MRELLEVKELVFGYGKERLLDGLSFSVPEGHWVAIVGENGSGKSTLIRLLLGELRPWSGSILLDGKPLRPGMAVPAVGYVPQLRDDQNLHFPITVEELVGLQASRRGWGPWLTKEEKKRIHECLSTVGMEHKKKSLFGELSGGQRQRVLLAKAIIHTPKFLVFDEPTTGVDQMGKEILYRLLSHLREAHNITILMITHELEGVKERLDGLYRMEEGRLLEVRE